jgi:aminoglycoside phosphotransferase (APT) family kinase protein
VFDDVPGAELSEARAWCANHLPPEDPAVLLHGDLLGQNILLGLGEHDPPAVIDWEYALRGDPAYELAIVTRGVRQPFQMAGGLDRLLDAYRQHGGISVTRDQVYLHEICLAVGWYRDSLAGHGMHPPEQALARVQGILRRAQA